MSSALTLIRKFALLLPTDRLLLLQAVFWLLISRWITATLPFRTIGWLATVTALRSISIPACPTEAKRIRWALITCARHVWWRAQCFEQGLAAHFMLRRRQVSSVLYYGVAPDDLNGLAAHVWVCADGLDIIGGESASRFAVLATFPK